MSLGLHPAGYRKTAFLPLPMALPNGTDGFPPCSLDCMATNLASAPAVFQNLKLLCANVTLEKSLADCVRGSCSFADQQKVVGQNNQICLDQPVQNKVVMATAVLGFLGLIANVAIGLRLYTRRKLASALGIGIDDYLMVAAAAVLAWVTITGTIEVIALGLGKHTFNVDPNDLLPDLILYWSDVIAYQIAMMLIKSSILSFYLRLFPERGFRIFCYIIIGWAVATGVAFLLITIFQCHPIRGVFDKSIQASCLDTNTFTYASSGFSIATDFTILLMPIPRLLKLKVPRRQRNGVLLLFSFGFLASIISVIRLPFIIQFGKTTDPLYDNIGPGIWTFSEMASAIIAACLPTLKPLAAKVFPRYFSDSQARESDQAPSPARQQTRNAPLGNITQAFNSLFSRTRPGAGEERRYFELKDGQIVQLKSRFSRLSLGFVSEEKDEDLEKIISKE